ncbi:hypothetical protein V3C99_004616 [Haemonchus contortus]|uniref:Uncharacterized protein n=1 Tax=Haemonchus contortus TaxID=6289 RepID=A0A7I4XXV3_HAECO
MQILIGWESSAWRLRIPKRSILHTLRYRLIASTSVTGAAFLAFLLRGFIRFHFVFARFASQQFLIVCYSELLKFRYCTMWLIFRSICIGNFDSTSHLTECPASKSHKCSSQ